MGWEAVSCPQCSAPLPRVALWRSVKCASCGSLITKTESVVRRDTFRKALERARRDHPATGRSIGCGGHGYELIGKMGEGGLSEVHLARRIGHMPLLATIKLSSAPEAAAIYAREAQVLDELTGTGNETARIFFSQVLPQVIFHGKVDGGFGQQALVFRHATGYWGSLAALNQRFPQGMDPRHVVWIWRRMLGTLGPLHSGGWAHGDVRPEHALVHPRDHGVRLIGWASARKGADVNARATDLMRSARIVLVLLNGTGDPDAVRGDVPAPLAELVTKASHDSDFCRAHGAQGLDVLLREAAGTAFGPPSFVPLSL